MLKAFSTFGSGAEVQTVRQFHSPAKILVSSPRDQSSFGQTTLHMAEVAVSRELCSDSGPHLAVRRSSPVGAARRHQGGQTNIGTGIIQGAGQ